MSGARSVELRPSTGASPALRQVAGQPCSGRPPRAARSTRRASPADGDVGGEVEHQLVELRRRRSGVPVTSAPSTWPSKPRRAPVERAAHQRALGRSRRRSVTRDRSAACRWRCRWRSARRSSRGIEQREVGQRGRRSRCRCRAVASWPSEVKAICGLARRRFSVRMPLASRTARPASVVSPASSGSRRGVAEARGRWRVPSSARSKPPLERAYAAVGAQVDAAAEVAAGERRRRSRGRRRAPRCGRCRSRSVEACRR